MSVERSEKQKNTTKRMIVMIICLVILFAGIAGSKMLSGYLNYKKMMAYPMTVTVSAMKAEYSAWQPLIKSSGSLRAIRGVNVTTDYAGLVQTIFFQPGAVVKQGDVLVQLNANSDIAQLRALEATADLARITYNRDKAQYAVQAISKAQLDTDEGNMKNTAAQAAAQAATVAKKLIRAPFAGRLGVSAVNPGQYINVGDKVVTLQQLDPIYVDFYVPQQDLVQLKSGQSISMMMDMLPGKSFTGKITTIDPLVDTSTRNAEVEATVANPNNELIPGMYAPVEVTVGEPLRYLTLPQTAISFNSYGDIVYLVKEKGKDSNGKPILIARQSFVTTGETRGDQIAVLTGLKEGDMVVTSGQLKLHNDMPITIDNKVVPANDPNPKVVDD